MTVKTLKELNLEIAEIDVQIEVLKKRREPLRREKRDLESNAFISMYSITLDDVQLSRGDGVPHHGHIMNFANWMKENGITKRFCEWNGLLYLTAEIIAGRMDHDAPGQIRDVPGYQE